MNGVAPSGLSALALARAVALAPPTYIFGYTCRYCFYTMLLMPFCLHVGLACLPASESSTNRWLGATSASARNWLNYF